MNRAQVISPPRSSRYLTQKLIGGLVVIVGLLLSAPFEPFATSQEVYAYTGILDSTAAAEPAIKAVRGQFCGRDFISEYGPLSQWIYGAWAASGSDDIASVLRWHNVVTTASTKILLWWVLALTAAPLSWRAYAFLLWIILWPFSEILPTLGFLVAILCGYWLGSARGPWRVGAYIAWALAAPVLMAMFFDLGVVAFAAFILCIIAGLMWTLGVSMVEAQTGRRQLLGAGFAVILGAGAVVASHFVPNPFQGYLRDSWHVTKAYWQTMAAPIETRYLVVLAASAIGSVLLSVYFGRRWCLFLNEDFRARGLALGLLAGACFSLASIRFGIPRSDGGHVCLAVTNVVCLAGCILPCYLRATCPNANWPATIVWAPVTLLALWLYLDSLALQLEVIRKSKWGQPEVAVMDSGIRDAVTAAKATSESELFVWPVESIVAYIAGKSNPSYTLKAYVAGTRYLENKTIARLAQTPSPVMYFLKSSPIDGVEHLTRTPRLFRYLAENYAISGPPHRDFLLLRRQAGRRESWRERELLRPEETYFPGQIEPLRITLPPQASEQCRASDLIILRLSAASQLLPALPKPGNLFVTLHLSHGGNRKQRILLPCDGMVHDVIISACTAEDPAFWSFLHPYRLWRSSTRVVGLELNWEPMDCLSREPAAITLHSISTLRQDGVEVQITGLAHSGDPELLHWCFGLGP